MASTPEVGAVVVGSGISGLAAALELQPGVPDVLVVDASDRPGGVMRTDHVGGYVVERGPNTVQVKAPMLGALRRLGLDEGLVRAEPESRLRFVARGGTLVPVPLSPLALLRTPLLSGRGKLRLLAEPFPRRRDASAESVAEFAGRRLGREAVDALIGPFLTGVYAGDERELGAGAVFGELVELERRYGSIALGALLRVLLRRGQRGLRGSHSAPEGLGPFARRLAERLNEAPVRGATVGSVRREPGAWVLTLSSASGESDLRAARLVLAVPAFEAARLLGPCDGELAELLGGVAYAPIATLPLGVEAAKLRRPVEGFGFLVPRDEELGILGCLFMSRLFPGRAPKGHELLHCMLGGARWPGAVDEPDDRLLECARAALDRVLGLGAEPEDLGVTRWPRAIPQPARDHVGRVARIRERARGLGGLALAGSYLDGVGVADAFASGLRAAADVG
jgi:oxygen-dependent protoporphyrinogen oxidase